LLQKINLVCLTTSFYLKLIGVQPSCLKATS
jgi:hypothetical protein